jgi:hypothetical protein
MLSAAFMPAFVLLVLSAFICIHLRPDMLFFGSTRQAKPIWPQMNADERGSNDGSHNPSA